MFCFLAAAALQGAQDSCSWSQTYTDGVRWAQMVVCHEVMSVAVGGAGGDRCG